MSRVDALDRGRESFRRQEWGCLRPAVGRGPSCPLSPMISNASRWPPTWRAGRDSEEAWTGAHHYSLAVADWRRAARCAFWLGITLINRMEPANGGGRLARAQRVLDDAQHECVERGWLLVPVALRQYHTGDFVGSDTIWAEAANIGASYNDVDLSDDRPARSGPGNDPVG